MPKRAFSIFLVLTILMIGGYSTTQPASAAVSIINGDFQTGDLTGWTFSTSQPAGNAVAVAAKIYTESVAGTPAYTITPDLTNNPQNTYFALLQPSLPGVYTILSQPFTASANDWISGEANFGSEDYLPYDDNAQVLILDNSGNTVATVFSASSSTIGGVRKTDWINWGYKFTAAGTYAVEARVANVGDDMRSSVLALDNVANLPLTSPYILNLPVVGSGTVAATTNGQPVSDLTKITGGTVVTLTATPAPGSNFAGWSGSALSSSLSTTVTMNSNMTVIAAFMPITCTFTMTTSGNGAVSATALVNGQSQNAPSGSILPWGTSVSLSAVPDPGWSFSNWSGGISNPSAQTGTILTGDFTANATFTQNVYTVTTGITTGSTGTGSISLSPSGPYHYGDPVQLTAVPGTNCSFTGWAGNLSSAANPDSVIVTSNLNITASFSSNNTGQVTLSVNVIGAGGVVITANKLPIVNGSSVTSGSTISLDARPATGWSFGNWSGGITGNTTPASFTISSNLNVTANFTQNTYSLTVNPTPTGTGTVIPNNPGPYHYGDQVQLTAVPAAGSYFAGWSGALGGTANPATVLISGDTIVGASFLSNPTSQLTLAIIVVGTGNVTTNPSAPYVSGTSVTLTAIPAAGWIFSGWTGDVISGYTSCTITVDANKAVTATFTQNVPGFYSVSVATNGNGTVSLSPSAGTYSSGTQVTLSAVPATGWSFANWSGGTTGTANQITITVNSNLAITANFVQNSFILAVYSNGNGTITGNANGSSYSYGASVTLTAVAAPGWKFTEWSGDLSGIGNYGANPIAISMTSNRSITANFTQNATNPYSVTVITNGGGTVTTNPNSPFYAPGASVTLFAAPNTGWDFSQWTETYQGLDKNNNSVTITITSKANPFIIPVNTNINIQANFNAITIASSANPAVYGQGITFTATVLGITTPGGTITFKDGMTTLGSSNLNSSGQAVVSTSTLTVGSHPITAQYAGDATYSGVSPALNQVINKANTAITLISSVSGNITSYDAIVSPVAPGNGVPTGAVTFDSSSSTILTAGQAIFTPASPLTGVIAVQYSGDTNFNGSTISVNAGAVTLNLTSNINPSVYGQTVNITAAVSANTIPTGTVTFMDGTTQLSVVTLDGSGIAALSKADLSVASHQITASYTGAAPASLIQIVNKADTSATVTAVGPGPSFTFTAAVSPNSPGAGTPTGTIAFYDGANQISGSVSLTSSQATYTTTLGAGIHSITAEYSGDGNFNPSTSAPINETIKSNSSVTVASSLNPSTSGQNVTFTATVTGATGIPTGSVIFLDGSNQLGPTLLSNGQAPFSTTAMGGGNHVITAQYSGDTTYNGSISTAINQAVDVPTTVTLFSAPNPSLQGQTVTLKATVHSSILVTGTVDFYDNTNNNSVYLGTGTTDGSGLAAFTISTLSSGTHLISARYSGDTYNIASNSSIVLSQVVQSNAGITLSASPNSSVYGQSVTFTATVTGSAGSTVTFFDGSNTLAPETISSGQATYTTSALVSGNHTISASYGAASAIVTQAVNKAATTTAVSTSASGGAYTYTFTAAVSANSPGAGIPTGTVTFTDGANSLGTATLSSGQASIPPVTLTAGTHTITAQYSSDSNFNSSSGSASVMVQAAKVASAISVATSPSPSTFGDSVTFTATVAGTSGTATGTVVFYDGSNTLGSGTLNNSGLATYSTSALAAGNHTITATYSGDSNYYSSTNTVAQTVNQANTTITLYSSLNPSKAGQSVTFKASVRGATCAGAPGGTVTFYDGSVVLGTGTLNSCGQATFQISTLVEGAHSITAVYGGNANFRGSTSSPLPQTVSNSCTRGYSLRILKSDGGTVSVQPSQKMYPAGTQVTVTATADAGYVFYGWEGNLKGSTNPATLTLNSDKTVEAIFKSTKSGSNYTLTTSAVGEGCINVNPLQKSYAQNTSVTLTATPADGYTFSAWQGDLTGSTNPAILIMNGSDTTKEVTAVFVPAQSNNPTASAISSNFNGTAIAAGNTIWFNSVFKVQGGQSDSLYTIYLQHSEIDFTAGNTPYKLKVPDAMITFSPSAAAAGTSFDTIANRWVTTVPSSISDGNIFLSGLAFTVPAGGLPKGISNINWSGGFSTDTPGIKVQWQWAAAVYTQFAANYNAANVKPVDDNKISQYQNSDHAGTPESCKNNVTGGATGGGGSNYTGSYSGTASVVPAPLMTKTNPPGNLTVTKMMINWNNQYGKPANDDNDKDDDQHSDGGKDPGNGWNWDNSHGGDRGNDNQANNFSLFQAWGQFQLPTGTKLSDLKSAATVTLTIHGSSVSDSQTFEKVQSTGDGAFWLHNSNEKNPAGGMDNTYINISWAPDKSNWTGCAGFHIKGIFQLPDKTIGRDTAPPEATLTISIPLVKQGNNSVSESRTVSFKVNVNQNLWQYNASGPDKFPYNLDDEN